MKSTLFVATVTARKLYVPNAGIFIQQDVSSDDAQTKLAEYIKTMNGPDEAGSFVQLGDIKPG